MDPVASRPAPLEAGLATGRRTSTVFVPLMVPVAIHPDLVALVSPWPVVEPWSPARAVILVVSIAVAVLAHALRVTAARAIAAGHVKPEEA